MTLKSDGLHRYSAKETRIFNLIAKAGKPVSTLNLLAGYYKINGIKIPLNGQVSINGAMRSLMAKAVLNKEPFKIVKSERRGPHPMEYWIEKK